MQQNDIQTAINYKKNVASKYMLVEGAKIKSRITGEDFSVTRKIDGHMQCVVYRDGQTFMLNATGKQMAEQLKCLEAFTFFMTKAGVKSAVIAAELYLPREGGRPRCGDVSRALADTELRNQLALAPFDIISIDNQPFESTHYKEVHQRLTELFRIKVTNDGKTQYKRSALCLPVELRAATSTDEIQTIYQEWVVEEGAEGLVVHSDSGVVAKVKPRHTIDAAVVGYTIGDNGVRDLMLAVAHPDNNMQVFALGSNGLTDEQRNTMAAQLEQMQVESQYILSDSRGVAYQMVRPELVLEISVLELVSRGNDDKIKTNALLQYDSQQGWLMMGMVPGVSALGMTVERLRDDKTASATDVRISQLTDICPFEENEQNATQMQPSTLLLRRVFKKVSGEKIMLHKFLIWKTNKDANPRFPAYIFYHTDYSSSRKELIKRDMLYSSSEEQIRAICDAEIADNIKKGWEEITE